MVKILTEASNEIGLGHITRCSSLYDECIARKIDCELIIYGDINGIKLLKNKKFINIDWKNISYLSNNISSNDYVILDSYIASESIYNLVSKQCKNSVFIDDIQRLNYPKGIIVNPSLDSSLDDYSNYNLGTCLCGPEFVILRSCFKDAKRFSTSSNIKRVLIVMGGTDTRELIPKIIDNICRENPRIIFDIITGTNYIKSYKERFIDISNIIFYTNLEANEMMNLMLSSDLSITAAGQTIYELIATQTPFIPIQVIENQKNNINSLLKYNPEQIVLKYDDINFTENLNKAFNIYADLEYRKKNIDCYRGLIDGYGSKRIVDCLLEDTYTDDKVFLRKATEKDMKDIFNLSNRDYVRQYSINKDKIKWIDHINWFNSVLKDESVVFYIATDLKKTFLGQVRYEVVKNSATVSISLTESIKGKGISKEILNESIKMIFEEKENLNEIIAFVSFDNIASKRLFQKLDFQRLTDENNMMKFILNKEEYYAN